MTAPAAPGRTRGPLALLLDLFSNVWLGVTLLSLLFVYSWVGSAGVPYYLGGLPWRIEAWSFEQIRQWPSLEMTEFEWFHWWPFDLLIGLICTNITVTTLRRIPLSTVNLGVWMIHSGILVLCFGSWLYFSTKVEGDTPVVRRTVVIQVPGAEPVRIPAVPGTRARAQSTEGRWDFMVQDADPHWVLLSGPDAGSQAYSVQVRVEGPVDTFIRQMIAGQPEATQDSLFVPGGDGPPLQRAVKVLGRPLVDESLDMRLEYDPQEWFYLANWVEKSWALYLRERGQTHWIQRPLDDLPLYNDFVGSLEEVWTPSGETLTARGLDLALHASESGDPLPDVTLRVRSYLRYAQMEERQVPGGRLNPTASVRLEDGQGEFFDHVLVAFEPERADASRGFLGLRWVEHEGDRAAAAGSSEPVLHLTIPGTTVHVDHTVAGVSVNDPSLPFLPVADSGYSFRVQFVEQLNEPGLPSSIASVELRHGDRRWRRFVSDDERFIRDVDSGDDGLTPTETFELDPGIEIGFHPASRPAAVTLVAGPGEQDLGLVLNVGVPQDGIYQPLSVGETFSLGGGDTVTVTNWSARSESQKRPAVVPRTLRNRDARESYSMVRVELTQGGTTQDLWVPFHQYPVASPTETLRRYWYDPARMILPDGREIEFVLSRERLPLPTPVVLEDFVVDSHVGGFTGRTSSILNWTSAVRFQEDDGQWGERQLVSVNAPTEHGGLWYFQAQWDPPSGARFQGDPPSKGLNYTVLGVGNRVGVGVQLLGCCIAVLGMIYAFYVKPLLIKRRRQAAGARKEVMA